MNWKQKTGLLAVLAAGMLLGGCAQADQIPASVPQPQSAPVESAESSASAQTVPDLQDGEALFERYLSRLVTSGIAAQTWTLPINIDTDTFLTYYALHLIEDRGEEVPAMIPADELYAYIEQEFGVEDGGFMPMHTLYDEGADAYPFEGLGSGTSGMVTDAVREGDRLTLDYEIYSRREDGTVIWGGTLLLALREDGSALYLENEMRYPIYPIGKDTAELQRMGETYLYPLNPTGDLLRREWERVDLLTADDLILFFCFNNLLGYELDFERCYAPDATAPAEQAEAALGEFFEVDSAKLRTSSFYLPDRNAYQMVGGFGGGGAVRALDYAEEGDRLRIVVGMYGPDDQSDRPRRVGVLEVQTRADGGFFYRSNRIWPDWPADPVPLDG